MAWARLDDKFHSHPKVRRAGLAAIGLHVRAISYSAAHLLDGHIDVEWVREAGGAQHKKLATALVEAGLWIQNGHGWIINDYLEYNPSREETAIKRDWDVKRKALFKDKELVAAIRLRDKDSCRYCGHKVNWKDRKGARGGTYDHVIPRGDNSLENVVVSCRECNMVKGARTPEQAGMELIRVRPDLDTGLDRSQI